ncbi:cardiolipin synthase (CMP-forming) isoform X1 [Mobula birostris]|uniref:cardiolipin synthase (CMP-forming) isoform X1 n=1 Tax=Mobula birostris TaxID=1983395 RepID=UPI003B2833BC
MFLRRSRWAIGGVGRVLSGPVRAGTGELRPGLSLSLHERTSSLLHGWDCRPQGSAALPFLAAGPGSGLRFTVTWPRPVSGRRPWCCAFLRKQVGPEVGPARRYGAGKPAPKRQAAEPYSYTGPGEKGEERAAAAAAGSPELYENPWTIPNLLCMARIGLSPYLGYLIVEEEFNLALGLFTLAGITDLLDGYIARNWANQKSALGSALDPLADKILISILYISLTYAELIPGPSGSHKLIESKAPLTVMVLLRDVILVAAGFYIRYRTVPTPRTLSKYFNPCYATAQLKPTFISKVNTAVQLVLVAASLAAPVFQFVDSMFLHTLWYVTALTTVASGCSYYIHGRNAVQVLNRVK